MGLFDTFKKSDNIITKKYLLHGKTIAISVNVDKSDSSKVISNKYSFANIRGQKTEMVSRTDKQEFFEEIATQIEYLNTRELNNNAMGPYFDALITGCIKHVNRYGRIIISDLWSQVNYTLWIAEAAKGIFHNLLNSEEECIGYREFLIDEGCKALFNVLWIPHPNGELDNNGMFKIVKASEVYS